MELQRLLSGKPDLKIKVAPSARQSVRKSGEQDARHQGIGPAGCRASG